MNITHPTALENGLCFHDYTPGKIKAVTVIGLNDASFSNIWYSKLVHTCKITTGIIHKHAGGSNRPIKRTPYFKCGLGLSKKCTNAITNVIPSIKPVRKKNDKQAQNENEP